MTKESEEEFDWGIGSTTELVVELFSWADRGTADAVTVAGEPGVTNADCGSELLAGSDAEADKLACA